MAELNAPSWENLDAVPPGHRSGFVAVLGRPNVGKSTLVNQLLGQKVTIVSPRPQTTRTRIVGILTRPEAQVIFVDTPGLHRPRHALGEAMVATASSAIPDADVVLLVTDVSTMPTDEDRTVARLIRERTGNPVIMALNKMDRLPPARVRAHTAAYEGIVPDHAGWMLTTATEAVNLDKLLSMIVAILPEGPRYYPGDQITDQTERQIAAELIREQVFRLTHDELPHAIATVVEEFKERESGATFIAATIYVERQSQKGIVIGSGGSMLRRIGTAARQEIERMTGGKVHLELWVKVSKRWRRDPQLIERMGYAPRG